MNQNLEDKIQLFTATLYKVFIMNAVLFNVDITTHFTKLHTN